MIKQNDAAAAMTNPLHGRFADVEVDERSRQLFRDGLLIPIEPKPFDLLCLLIRRQGEAVSKQTLIDDLWDGRVVSDSVIARAVTKLRRALGTAAASAIETAHGYGYRFGGDFHPLPPAADPASATAPSPTAAASAPRTSHRNRSAGARTAGWLLGGLMVVLMGWMGARVLIEADQPTVGTEPRQPTIAVLPFENYSEHPDATRYLVDAVHENVLTHLSRVQDLRVISRTSVERYRDSQASVPEIGRRLGVNHVLEGSVQRIGQRLRVNAQLVEVATDTHLWVDVLDGELADVFEIQSQIAQHVAASIGATLRPTEVQAMTQVPTTDASAYQAYLQARDELRRDGTGRASLFRSQALLDRAVAEDPDFALAQATLARVHTFTHWFGYDTDPRRLQQASDALDAALGADPDLAEAHLALGLYRAAGFRDYIGALAAYQQAELRQPGAADIKHYMASAHRRLGQWEAAVSMMQSAVASDPENLSLLADFAGLLRGLRRYEEAAPLYQRLAALDPDDPFKRIDHAMFIVESRGDTAPLRRVLNDIPADVDPGHSITYMRYIAAAWESDLERAAALINRYPRTWLPASGGLGRTPRALAQGLMAVLRDDPGAGRHLQTARDHLETARQSQPNNPGFEADLALVAAGLGDKLTSLQHGQRALDLMPVDVDPVGYSDVATRVAMAWALAGEQSRCLDLLEQLYRQPFGPSIQFLRLHPVWSPLRGLPRFQQLLGQ